MDSDESCTALDQRMQAAYDQIAPVFAEAAQAGMPAALQPLAQTMVTAVGHGARLLDLGCGTGRDLAYFAQHGLQTIGLDQSLGMLHYAARKSSGPLIQARLQALPLAAECIDAIWCCAALLHLPKAWMPAVLTDMRRILRPAGWFMISMQLGDCEEWNGGYVDGVQRFFARYQPEELDVLVLAQGFRIHERTSDTSAARHWYSVLCQYEGA